MMASYKELFTGCVILVLAGGQLLHAAKNPRLNRGALPGAEAASAARKPSFRADAWHLPDEPLLGFVEIPGGEFLMGSDPARDPLAFDNEYWEESRTQHRVNVPAYYMARYEVTVAQFRAFVEASGYRVQAQTLTGAADHPVTFVSWPDALAYTRWLQTALASWDSAPPAVTRLLREGFRVSLPTEEEWEKAARGTDGRTFPWGNETRSHLANFRGSGTRAVGSLECPECAYGLSDMSGNVWEWTRTPYRSGPYGDYRAPLDLAADAIWIMRGGSFADEERNIRAAIRGGADPGVRRPFIGFRVALRRNGG